jgi:hypothetical protein
VLVVPGKPAVVLIVTEPAHGAVTVGAGTVSIGLMPMLLSSVAPSGIVPPLSVKVEPDPGVDSGDAVPLDETVGEEAQLDIDVAEAVDPPPSKVEFVAADDPVPETLVPESPEELALQFGLGAGLKPPGSTSVAPSGRPVPLAPVAPSVPSGDVTPIPGMLVEVCA